MSKENRKPLLQKRTLNRNLLGQNTAPFEAPKIVSVADRAAGNLIEFLT
jgi:hypothetical protein